MSFVKADANLREILYVNCAKLSPFRKGGGSRGQSPSEPGDLSLFGVKPFTLSGLYLPRTPVALCMATKGIKALLRPITQSPSGTARSFSLRSARKLANIDNVAQITTSRRFAQTRRARGATVCLFALGDNGRFLHPPPTPPSKEGRSEPRF